jgi:hypothetical protein
MVIFHSYVSLLEGREVSSGCFGFRRSSWDDRQSAVHQARVPRRFVECKGMAALSTLAPCMCSGVVGPGGRGNEFKDRPFWETWGDSNRRE